MERFKEVTKQINSFLRENNTSFKFADLTFSRSLNETWFSDTLAWLLNPKGSHKLGDSFITEFLKVIARERKDKKYNHKKTMLIWGKTREKGRSALTFSLRNAAVVREFYLAKSMGSKNDRAQRYCDVAVIDLDSKDGLFLVVENKLFYTNHPHQLKDYYNIVEKKFYKAKVREYVYLTLLGDEPYPHTRDDKKYYKNWVNISWINDILEIINKIPADKANPEIKRIQIILQWMHNLNKENIKHSVEDLRVLLVQATAKCLVEELERLGEGKVGNWQIKKDDKKSITIHHTSVPSRKLYVELLPNLSITVQSRKKGKSLFDKIIVPFGANTDQIYNLIDIVAGDIYRYVFTESVDRYRANKKRQTVTVSDLRKTYKPLFDFIEKSRFSLTILFSFLKKTKEAQACENNED